MIYNADGEFNHHRAQVVWCAPMNVNDWIPLASSADQALAELAKATGSAAIRALDGATLLCERAMRAGMRIPERTSAGGGCHLFDAIGDTIALNLARPCDREMLPALFETDGLDTKDDAAIAARIERLDAHALVLRGRSMGLAIGAEDETRLAPGGDGNDVAGTAWVELVCGCHSSTLARSTPRVVDLSALWAGPLAAHLLWLAGAEVVKVESRARPDAMRDAQSDFYALLNQGKASVALDLANRVDRHALLTLIGASDIVIEASRPRALAQLGIDAAQIVRTTPGLVWVSITAHGAEGDAADWVGFGDDCAVSGGLSAALRAVTGRTGFVGDALADPLTGIFAALAAWQTWNSGRGARLGLAMSQIVARCLAAVRQEDPDRLRSCLNAWGRAVGKPFPTVTHRSIGTLPSFAADTRSCLARFAR
jgi:hypothetical protein